MRATLFVTLVMFAASSPAFAGNAKEDVRARKIMYDYARCVVKLKPQRAANAILANSDNSEILKEYPDLISSNCMAQVAGNVKMTFGGDLYRYALADALVNAKFSEKFETNFSNRLPLAHLRPSTPEELEAKLGKEKSKRARTKIQEDEDKRAGITWLSHYGECIVRKDPVRARLWLLTPPDGPEEVSRIGDLRPTFSDCLDGGTVKFTRVTLRGAVAINYFRLASATPQLIAEKAQ
ncbi:hypothetical protein J2W40_000757 [Sphingobium xenophagum]|uniref:Uncharacterized protein n=1 Tax=Sphingobium xenophagum TaxID=121428 RepID=A0ABU1WY10_SPHXE|nr:hypothetical protein [Sphingobium xenophagum]MDR7153954.1 hypothetical protein [Sphingobium xenophagum]